MCVCVVMLCVEWRSAGRGSCVVCTQSQTGLRAHATSNGSMFFYAECVVCDEVENSQHETRIRGENIVDYRLTLPLERLQTTLLIV